MNDVELLFQQACSALQKQDIHAAKSLFTQILTRNPEHIGSIHQLGILAYHQGQMENAIHWFKRASTIEPHNPTFLSCLGSAYQAQEDYDHALECHMQALQGNPNHPLSLSNLGITLVSLDRTEDAIEAFQKALEFDPNDPATLCNLGAAYRAVQNLDDAERCYIQALEIAPGLAQAHFNLGNVYLEQGKMDDALSQYQQTLRIAPNFVQAHLSIGKLFQQRGLLTQAQNSFQQAISVEPTNAQAQIHMALLLLQRNQPKETILHAKRAVEISPSNAECLNTLGNAFSALGNVDEAIQSYEKATECNPRLTQARYNRGLALQTQGNLKEAKDAYQEVMKEKPTDAVTHSTYLGSLIYDPDLSLSELAKEHQAWEPCHHGARIERPLHDPDPNRPLRIGYVSPDFRSHAVAAFLEPLLTCHNKEQCEVFSYAEVSAPDEVTARLQIKSHHFNNTIGMSTEQMIEQITKDRIDILVELAGHTAHHRLAVFANKPAPIQISYLGYPFTVGLSTMDYRFSDAILFSDEENAVCSEELLTLPGCFCCFQPQHHNPVSMALPETTKGYITFGSLHKLEKLNDRVLALWSQILQRVPHSRLLISRNTLKGSTEKMLRERLKRHGISQQQLLMRSVAPVHGEHLEIYRDIDIALDPFPWTGHTTACEALWMGVPVVTLHGHHTPSRLVSSILHAAQLPELIAKSEEDYISIACHLAKDRAKRQEYRQTLRGRLLRSPLCDMKTFTRQVEKTYRTLWKERCRKG